MALFISIFSVRDIIVSKTVNNENKCIQNGNSTRGMGNYDVLFCQIDACFILVLFVAGIIHCQASQIYKFVPYLSKYVVNATLLISDIGLHKLVFVYNKNYTLSIATRTRTILIFLNNSPSLLTSPLSHVIIIINNFHHYHYHTITIILTHIIITL